MIRVHEGLLFSQKHVKPASSVKKSEHSQAILSPDTRSGLLTGATEGVICDRGRDSFVFQMRVLLINSF